MVICAMKDVFGAPEPPTREAIEQERRRQLDALSEYRRRLKRDELFATTDGTVWLLE